jgi:hypothetical protein
LFQNDHIQTPRGFGEQPKHIQGPHNNIILFSAVLE